MTNGYMPKKWYQGWYINDKEEWKDQVSILRKVEIQLLISYILLKWYNGGKLVLHVSSFVYTGYWFTMSSQMLVNAIDAVISYRSIYPGKMEGVHKFHLVLLQ